MVGRIAGEQLRLRKQALILESGINRRLLATEWQRVRAAAAWIGEVKRFGRQARTWWPVLAPLLGLLIARRLRRSSPGVSRTGMLLNLLETALSLWKQFAPRKSGDEPPADRPD
jgi:hypothetical protein